MNTQFVVPSVRFGGALTACLVALASFSLARPVQGDSFNYSLADQSASVGGQHYGFQLYFEDQSAAPRTSLSSLTLKLKIGDGTVNGWHWLDFGYGGKNSNGTWKTPFGYGTDHGTNYYWVKAVIPPGSGSTKLYLNDNLVATVPTNFAPLNAESPDPNLVATGLSISNRNSLGDENYFIRQTAMSMAYGSTTPVAATFPSKVPLNMYAFSPENPVRMPWSTPTGQTVTISISFYIEQRPAITGPAVDDFGQSVAASWTGKVANLSALTTEWSSEDATANSKGLTIPPSYDAYGGYTLHPSWTPSGTNAYYRLAQDPSTHYWWLVTPLGNPCFYLGIDSILGTSDASAFTGREVLFPSNYVAGSVPSVGWANASDGTNTGKAFSFLTYNMSRRYGGTSAFTTTVRDKAMNRAKRWGFSGFGKWSGFSTETTPPIQPVQPVVKLPGSVTKIAGNVYDIWDPSIKSALDSYILSSVQPHITDKNVLGWSFGNENEGIVWDQDILTMLRKPGGTPAKHELINYMRGNYGNSSVQMADAWQVPITAAVRSAGATDPVAAQPTIEAYSFPDPVTVPPGDITKMRRYFANTYYAYIENEFKTDDPNHLYFGFWIAIGTWEEEYDWTMIANHCDVIGYDNYDTAFADARMNRLINSTTRPVLCGEWSFPGYYNGARGFANTAVSTADDAASGNSYKTWVTAAAQNKYCVGAHWFEYHDQPVIGKGQLQAPGATPQLVLNEHSAYGLVDITDRPKWDMLTKVREANIAAAPLRLGAQTPAPKTAVKTPTDSARVGALPRRSPSSARNDG